MKDWDESHPDVPEELLRRQGARCMDCGTPFCHTGKLIAGMASGCPINNLIPDWNDLVYRGQWREAAIRLHQTNNFPEFTGRVCPAPCEGSCTLALNDDAVTIKAIECAIVDRAFDEGWVSPEAPATRTGKSVAVVGSGPAGLACAAQLNKAGHTVTVFERADRVGGLLMYGIPNMKLDKRLVERRVRLMADAGIRFVTGVEIGRDVPVAEPPDGLRRRRPLHRLHGRPRPDGRGAEPLRDPPRDGVPPREHAEPPRLGPRRRPLHLGRREERRRHRRRGHGDRLRRDGPAPRGGGRRPARDPRRGRPDRRAADNPWPQWPKLYKLDYGQEEAAALQGGGPPPVLGPDEALRRATPRGACARSTRSRWSGGRAPDGRPQLHELPGTEQVVPADLVLLALGFLGPERRGPVEELGIRLDERGNVVTDAEKMTSVPGVFAAGDAVRGQSLVVWAIHEGRKAARGVDRHLMYGETYLP